MSGERPTTLLIAAMGGEGGGVLAGWIVAAAQAEGLVVQSTSIPGVAQRTGATTYYIEMAAPAGADVASRRPVMSLYPVPGNVDVMVASELVEAGRAMQNGFVTPDFTTLIASTHRVYAINERTAMADDRFDGERVTQAAPELARQTVMFDMNALAQAHASVINAVLLGAIAGADCLPVPVERFREAVRAHGVAVDRSLAAFDAGMAQAREGLAPAVRPDSDFKRPASRAEAAAEPLLARVEQDFPAAAHEILREGVNRLIDYQGAGYARSYLSRLAAVRDADSAGDGAILRETARHLALWMSFEDLVRVAQAKTRGGRFARIRAEVGAAGDDPVRIVEFLKPGVEEACALLPAWLARPIIANAERGGWLTRFNVGLHVSSTSISGYLMLRGLAKLRWLRPYGYRYKEEQAAIDAWLGAIVAAAGLDRTLALEVAQCAGLRKGYSDTHRRGRASYDGIMATLVRPTLAGEMAPAAAAAALAGARRAALADPDGQALAEALTAPAPVAAAAE